MPGIIFPSKDVGKREAIEKGSPRKRSKLVSAKNSILFFSVRSFGLFLLATRTKNVACLALRKNQTDYFT